MKNVLQEKNRTLLGRFIQKKVQEYIEPSKEGTPRGEPVGFSGAKYGASLYGLTNIKQKEIAEHLNISHGLLRKWNTEEAFKEMVDKHCREFAEVFIRNVRDRIKRRETLNDSYHAQSFQEMARQDLPYLDHKEIGDAADYSDRVNFYIDNALNAETEKSIKEGNINLSLEIFNVIQAIKFFTGIKDERNAEVLKEVKAKMLKALTDNGVEILSKPVISEADKKNLLIIMKSLAE